MIGLGESYSAHAIADVTSEVFPLTKIGGLANVSAALPATLGEFDIDVRLLMPGYPQAIYRASNRREIARLGNILGCNQVQLVAACSPTPTFKSGPWIALRLMTVWVEFIRMKWQGLAR